MAAPDISSFSYKFISWSLFQQLSLYGITDTCSFLDVLFFTAKVLSLIFVSYIIYRLDVEVIGVYDEFCLVEVLQPRTNLLISGEHITYNPIVAVNFY